MLSLPWEGFGEIELGLLFLDALKAEINEIEAELAADPRFVKLRGLQAVLALYETSGRAREGISAEVAAPIRTVTRVPSEARSRAMELAELFLRNRVGPTPTREILEHIQAFGGEIGGKEPVSNLSAMLSNSGKFQSHGRAGWTLADEDAEPLGLETVANVIEYVMADLTTDQILEAYSLYAATKMVEHDLDSRLLSETRRRISRHLTDNEMRTLRTGFGRALANHVPDA